MSGCGNGLRSGPPRRKPKTEAPNARWAPDPPTAEDPRQACGVAADEHCADEPRRLL